MPPTTAGGSAARFEFRCWPEALPSAYRSLCSTWQREGREVRTDIYLLAPRAEARIVKLRDGLHLDVKRLVEERSGLQRWQPILSSDFPLRPADLVVALQSLGIDGSASRAARRSPAHFLADLLDRKREVRPLNVRKTRLRFSLDGTLAEATKLQAAGRGLLTFAVESGDAETVLAAIRALDLAGFPNRDYDSVLSSLASAGTL